jgi:hypothetical protein
VSPVTNEDLQSGSVRALVTDVSTGVTQELTTRKDSSCLFFEPFECAPYEVRLRLDWKDLDEQGNPTLDADFYHLKTGAMDKPMKKHAAHHTSAGAAGGRIYEWEFADEFRHLRVTLTWRKILSGELPPMQGRVFFRVIRADET